MNGPQAFYAIAVVVLCLSVTYVYVSHNNGGLLLLSERSDQLPHSAISAVSGTLFQPNVKRRSLNPPFMDLNLTSATRCKHPLVAVTTTLRSTSTNIDEVALMMPVVVVGDKGVVSDFVSVKSSQVTYLSVAQQHALYPQVSKTIPTRSFARKNIGFLHALHLGACNIWDFDDDNFLTKDTKRLLATVIKTKTLPQPDLQLTAKDGVVNPYLLYGAPEFIWPRGYPLELLARRRFPRLVKPTAAEPVDVLQVMQNVDPDVDANWRLEYGRHLPMTWSAATMIAGSCLAISGSNYAPYNAQATLLSRRATAVSLLPHTVNGRVSDIWRSYATQYLLHSLDEPGAIAFSGAFVSHRRNNHSYMADRQAETQLYEQASALTLYLSQRPLRAALSNLLQELVFLYDDLYQRGFLEAGDVHTAIAWAKAVAALYPSPTISQRRKQAEPETDTASPADVLAVVHINRGHRKVIPVWMSLHAHKFAAVAFYMPGAYAEGISGIQPIRVSKDSKGYAAYESALDTVEHVWFNKCDHAVFWELAKKCSALQGVFFLHDDAVLHMPRFDTDVSTSPSRRELAWNATEWTWIPPGWGRAAWDNFTQQYNTSMPPFRGQSDSFYVARKNFQVFVELAANLLSSKVFLELAVPSIAHALDWGELKLTTAWDHSRRNATSLALRCCQESCDVVHPLKLRDMAGLLSHLHMEEC